MSKMSSIKSKQVLAEEQAFEWLIRIESPDFGKQDEVHFWQWLNEDASHQKAYVLAEEVWARGKAMAAVAQETEVDLEGRRSDVYSLVRTSYGRMASLAAVACVVMSIVALWLVVKPSPLDSQMIITKVGERTSIELRDSTLVTVNTNSNVKIDLRDNVERLVSLNEGEVYFEVAPHKDRPFIVRAGDIEVEVLGTKFSVRKTASGAVVTVVEGFVKVAREGDSLLEESVILSQGEHLKVDRNALDLKKVDPTVELSWLDSRLKFFEVPLEQVVEELNRYYDRQLVVGDPELKERRVVAVFSLDAEIEVNLAMLEQSLKLKSRQSADKASYLLYPR